MRTALSVAFGLAVAVGGVPASIAQDSRVPDQSKPAGTGVEAEQPQTPGNTGISLAVPTGRVSVGHDLDGEPVYVRRTTVRDGMTIVEVSTTPFAPVMASNEQVPGVRPDQPAGW